jgi:uncharacterized membrane protein YkvA (DUF1232 family)
VARVDGQGRLLVGLVVVLLVAMLVGAIVVLVKLVRARRVLKDAGLPQSGKLTFWAAVAYLVCPIDLLPDPVYLDDIGVLLLAVRSLHSAATAVAARRETDPRRPRRKQRT